MGKLPCHLGDFPEMKSQYAESRYTIKKVLAEQAAQEISYGGSQGTLMVQGLCDSFSKRL